MKSKFLMILNTRIGIGYSLATRKLIASFIPRMATDSGFTERFLAKLKNWETFWLVLKIIVVEWWKYSAPAQKTNYRVSHSEVYKVNQLWGVEGPIILLNYGAQWLQEVWTFVFYQSVFKKMTSAGLNSLRQKGC